MFSSPMEDCSIGDAQKVPVPCSPVMDTCKNEERDESDVEANFFGVEIEGQGGREQEQETKQDREPEQDTSSNMSATWRPRRVLEYKEEACPQTRTNQTRDKTSLLITAPAEDQTHNNCVVSQHDEESCELDAVSPLSNLHTDGSEQSQSSAERDEQQCQSTAAACDGRGGRGMGTATRAGHRRDDHQDEHDGCTMEEQQPANETTEQVDKDSSRVIELENFVREQSRQFFRMVAGWNSLQTVTSFFYTWRHIAVSRKLRRVSSTDHQQATGQTISTVTVGMKELPQRRTKELSVEQTGMVTGVHIFPCKEILQQLRATERDSARKDLSDSRRKENELRTEVAALDQSLMRVRGDLIQSEEQRALLHRELAQLRMELREAHQRIDGYETAAEDQAVQRNKVEEEREGTAGPLVNDAAFTSRDDDEKKHKQTNECGVQANLPSVALGAPEQCKEGRAPTLDMGGKMSCDKTSVDVGISTDFVDAPFATLQQLQNANANAADGGAMVNVTESPPPKEPPVVFEAGSSVLAIVSSRSGAEQASDGGERDLANVGAQDLVQLGGVDAGLSSSAERMRSISGDATNGSSSNVGSPSRVLTGTRAACSPGYEKTFLSVHDRVRVSENDYFTPRAADSNLAGTGTTTNPNPFLANAKGSLLRSSLHSERARTGLLRKRGRMATSKPDNSEEIVGKTSGRASNSTSTNTRLLGVDEDATHSPGGRACGKSRTSGRCASRQVEDILEEEVELVFEPEAEGDGEGHDEQHAEPFFHPLGHDADPNIIAAASGIRTNHRAPATTDQDRHQKRQGSDFSRLGRNIINALEEPSRPPRLGSSPRGASARSRSGSLELLQQQLQRQSEHGSEDLRKFSVSPQGPMSHLHTLAPAALGRSSIGTTPLVPTPDVLDKNGAAKTSQNSTPANFAPSAAVERNKDHVSGRTIFANPVFAGTNGGATMAFASSPLDGGGKNFDLSPPHLNKTGTNGIAAYGGGQKGSSVAADQRLDHEGAGGCIRSDSAKHVQSGQQGFQQPPNLHSHAAGGQVDQEQGSSSTAVPGAAAAEKFVDKHSAVRMQPPDHSLNGATRGQLLHMPLQSSGSTARLPRKVSSDMFSVSSWVSSSNTDGAPPGTTHLRPDHEQQNMNNHNHQYLPAGSTGTRKDSLEDILMMTSGGNIVEGPRKTAKDPSKHAANKDDAGGAGGNHVEARSTPVFAFDQQYGEVARPLFSSDNRRRTAPSFYPSSRTLFSSKNDAPGHVGQRHIVDSRTFGSTVFGGGAAAAGKTTANNSKKGSATTTAAGAGATMKATRATEPSFHFKSARSPMSLGASATATAHFQRAGSEASSSIKRDDLAATENFKCSSEADTAKMKETVLTPAQLKGTAKIGEVRHLAATRDSAGRTPQFSPKYPVGEITSAMLNLLQQEERNEPQWADYMQERNGLRSSSSAAVGASTQIPTATTKNDLRRLTEYRDKQPPHDTIPLSGQDRLRAGVGTPAEQQKVNGRTTVLAPAAESTKSVPVFLGKMGSKTSSKKEHDDVGHSHPHGHDFLSSTKGKKAASTRESIASSARLSLGSNGSGGHHVRGLRSSLPPKLNHDTIPVDSTALHPQEQQFLTQQRQIANQGAGTYHATPPTSYSGTTDRDVGSGRKPTQVSTPPPMSMFSPGSGSAAQIGAVPTPMGRSHYQVVVPQQPTSRQMKLIGSQSASCLHRGHINRDTPRTTQMLDAPPPSARAKQQQQARVVYYAQAEHHQPRSARSSERLTKLLSPRVIMPVGTTRGSPQLLAAATASPGLGVESSGSRSARLRYNIK
ncbi:unnamed protein product [Amoebophrya sp. A120]|nr:unnamed protein product [Amoebophrya sp. A120]|eukprot:GSA120T00004349001.1